jgi:hypothetical protein
MGDRVAVLDFLGTVIEPGHMVVYPGRHGSELWLNRATVLDVNADASLTVETEGGIKKRVVRTDRVAIVG